MSQESCCKRAWNTIYSVYEAANPQYIVPEGVGFANRPGAAVVGSGPVASGTDSYAGGTHCGIGEGECRTPHTAGQGIEELFDLVQAALERYRQAAEAARGGDVIVDRITRNVLEKLGK
mgnify:CR=1 FL=1